MEHKGHFQSPLGYMRFCTFQFTTKILWSQSVYRLANHRSSLFEFAAGMIDSSTRKIQTGDQHLGQSLTLAIHCRKLRSQSL